MIASAGSAARTQSASRIENDIEILKGLINNVESTTERVMRHARSLGYFEPPKDDPRVAAPTPVVTTLADAMQALARAIDHCSGALNVFD